MKKYRKITFCTILCIAMLIMAAVTGFKANAEENQEEQKVAETGYLYNMYDEPEYTFTTFENGGYKICHEKSGETVEYSAAGTLPYEAGEKKYYGGPLNYLRKNGDSFYDVLNSDKYGNSPDKKFDDGAAIHGTDSGITGLKTVGNNYFSTIPTYGTNIHNTCGSVATQILLSYNNYYFDRRIIAPEYLNGRWKGGINSDRFDSDNYDSSAKDPNVCYDPRRMTSEILGTNEAFYQRVIQAVEPNAFNCKETTIKTTVDKDKKLKWTETIVKDYYGNVISNKTTGPEEAKEGEEPSESTSHSHSGSYPWDVENGIKKLIDSSVQYEVKRDYNLLGFNNNQINVVKNEIDQNRAVILTLSKLLGGEDHFVVAYGYADYTNSATGKSNKGFITNFGWSNDFFDVWVNSSWCFEYVILQIDHEHNYTVDTGKNVGNDKRELRCGECGHRTLDDLYDIDDSGGITAKYELTGDITIPSMVAEREVKCIDDRAFVYMYNLTSVKFDYDSKIRSIGNSAFAGCSRLNCFGSYVAGRFNLPYSIEFVGANAFSGTAFENITISSPAYLGNEIFSDCSNVSNVYIQSVENIGDKSFYNCSNLKFVTVSKLLNHIGTSVFENCTNLESIDLPDDLEVVGVRAFKNCTNLTEVNISEQVYLINYEAFSGCTGLSKITFGSREKQAPVTSLRIEDKAFAMCAITENLVIPEFVTSLGNGAFENVNLNKVYYDGSRVAYAKLKANSSANDNFFNADTYFYSANKPFSGTNYWRYDSEGDPEIWPSKQLQGITANGESRAVTTDAIVITFDSDPGENFGVNNVYTNGANVDAVSGSETTRVITVSEVTVKDGEKLKFTLKPAGDYYFVNREIEVAVCAKVCKIFYYEAGKNFFSGDISDCPTEYMEGQTTKLVTPMKFGFEFDGWHLNEDGSGERIYNITPDYRGNITLYAKWERNDALSWGDENFKIMYYTEKSRTDNLDILFKSEDGFGDLSYYVREALFPALAQLRVDGYGYELNSTLISAYYPDDDKMSATIVLNDGLKFSSDNNLTANDFKAYYDFVVNAYEDLPKPLKHILGVEANDSRTLEIFLTRPYDIMYVLSELRAVDSELLGEISGMTIEEANACVYAMAADVVTYGRYKIGEISEAGGIFLMPNEKYTFYNENSANDITLYICDDVQEAGAKYFSGETDACYNFNAEDASDIWAGEETHAYDDRVRMYLALNSTAFPRCSESDKQTIIYALGLLIDYDLIKMVFSEAEHENNKWFPDGYPFEGLPVDEYFDDEWVSGINYQSDIADRQAKARMIFNDELKINPRELVLTINVKNEERYIILADILKNSFDAVDIRLEVNYVETEEEANDGDLFFVFYDFTGKVIPDENFLENDNISIIFTLCGDVDEEFIRRLTEEYEEAETESEKLEILGEIQNIMAFYVVKINHIDKYYLASPEYFEFTNGHLANLVY